MDVGAGNGADAEAAVPLIEAATAVGGVEVETVLADMAYSGGDTRVAMEEAGAEVVAKVPPVRNAGRFPKTEFAIDTDAGTVTCPAGVTCGVKELDRRPDLAVSRRGDLRSDFL